MMMATKQFCKEPLIPVFPGIKQSHTHLSSQVNVIDASMLINAISLYHTTTLI